LFNRRLRVLSPAVRTKNLHHPLPQTNNCALSLECEHSAAFKRQVAQEFIAGETLHGLSKRHDVSRQLIR